MKIKFVHLFLVICISTLMLMPSVFAAPVPPIWFNQATLSLVDGNPSQDPENSGFGLTQAVVWEEWNPLTASWDIMMKYNTNDGNPINWVPGLLIPPITVAGTAVDEINPAVTVTNNNPATGFQEIHVVYQRWNPAGGQWDVCHTWTPIPAIAWSAPMILDIFVCRDAVDPAIVYTEDLLTTNGVLAYAVQFVWSEFNPAAGFYEIQYDAHYFDTAAMIIRGYVGPTLIRGAATGAVGNCDFPEIASVDETAIAASNSYYFSIVWQEPNVTGQINVWYNDGITQTFPVMGTVIFGAGQINPVGLPGDSYHPDIAVAQDYGPPGTEIYYFHVNWIYWDPRPPTWQIDTCYTAGLAPSPGAAALAAGLTAPARGPVGFALEEPTIATRLIPPTNGGPIFETWMGWQDSVPNPAASPPDIWFRVGQYTGGGPPFAYTVPAAIVPYVQPAIAPLENNPELWNRCDSIRLYNPFTHLVFDMTQVLGPLSAQEVEYIDP